jgi:hypothetical protein
MRLHFSCILLSRLVPFVHGDKYPPTTPEACRFLLELLKVSATYAVDMRANEALACHDIRPLVIGDLALA